MKIILSRKGMDSENGGIPSPILNDRFVMLPIPSDDPLIRYSDLQACGTNLGTVASQLGATVSRKPLDPNSHCHLDPDLDKNTIARPPGWRPIFGQTKIAAAHLKRQGVGAGDLFLFFGWFREALLINERFSFRKDAQGFHALFGWLQVSAVIDCAHNIPADFAWAKSHPHIHGKYGLAYISAKSLQLGSAKSVLPGGGVFPFYHSCLRLTAPGQPNRSLWKVPQWCFPKSGIYPMTYHRRDIRYKSAGDHVLLSTVAKGQEFVIDATAFPEAVSWASDLITTAHIAAQQVTPGSAEVP